MKIKTDLTGKQFHWLKVIELTWPPRGKQRKWKCKCVCGKETFVSTKDLVSGHSKSCGCMSSKLKSQSETKSLIGKRFGRLTVENRVEGTFRTPKGVPQVKYSCKCDCGNTVEVYAGNLRKGNTKSCGCLNLEATSERGLIDLSGKRFGFLTVLNRANDYMSPSGNKAAQWLCRCECGKETIVNGSSLRRGATKSCGCAKDSCGEAVIRNYLSTHNIPFEAEFSFDDLLTEKGNPMRFDFAIFNSNNNLQFLIEYQGPQHFSAFAYNNQNFGKQQREVTDPAKRAYTENNNIILHEIRFDEDIEERLNEIFGQYGYVNSVPSE